LWELAPPAFHDAYWTMRGALGDGYTIQFITDEPYIPWELMRPVRAGELTRLLAETHPVARGLLKYPDRLRPVLPLYGEILTVAPDYAKRVTSPLPPLVAAGEESAMLQARFGAQPIAPASARRIIATFADARKKPVRLLHFAGHGRFETPADSSHLACEDGDVSIHHVRSQDTRLGENYKTFVILNACELGATGDVLGEVGGWAEAFAYRNFSGFIAPLWAVFDDHAKLAMQTFFEAILVNGKPVGEALRDVRAAYGPHSPTFLSYVYYGDVNARFG
jgi:CHAT domain-containing protein